MRLTRLLHCARQPSDHAHERPPVHERAARILPDSGCAVLRFLFLAIRWAGVVRRCVGRCVEEWNGTVWHLIEDFFEQGIVVKLFLGVGWLAVVIMVASFLALIFP